MAKKLTNKLQEVIVCITESEDYKKCISLKEKMSANHELIDLINDIKTLQKKYIKSSYSSEIKEKLDNLAEKINQIPIYVTYIKHLEKVNMMISLVKDELNQYFYKLLNENELAVNKH